MNEKEAFILGAAQYCKSAGIVGEDRDEFVRLVADGDAKTIALVKAAAGKKDEKKDEKASKDPEPEVPAEKAVEPKKKKTRPFRSQLPGPPKLKSEKGPSKEYLAELMSGLQGSNLADAPRETLGDLMKAMPHLKGEQLTQAINQIAGAGTGRESWQAKPKYLSTKDWLFGDAMGSERGKGVTRGYGQLLNSAMEQMQARLKANPKDPLAKQQYQALATQYHRTVGGQATTPEEAERLGAQATQSMVREVRLERGAEAAAATGDWDTYKNNMQQVYKARGWDDREALAQAEGAAKQYEQTLAAKQKPAEPAATTPAAGQPAPATAPTTQTPLTDDERAASQKSLDRIMGWKGGVPAADDKANREWFMNTLQEGMKVAGEQDPEKLKTIVGLARQLKMSPEEQTAYAPMMQSLTHSVHKAGDWESLASLKRDEEMSKVLTPELLENEAVKNMEEARLRGGEEGAAMAAQIAQEYKDDPGVQEYLKLRQGIEKPVAAAMATAQRTHPDIAAANKKKEDEVRDAEKPLEQQSIETLRKMWERDDPVIRRYKQRGLDADKFWMRNRGATAEREDRLEMRSLQNRMGTNFSWPELANMSEERLQQLSGGNADKYEVFKDMQALATRLGAKKLPAAAGKPSAEQAVSQGADPKETVTPQEEAAAQQTSDKIVGIGQTAGGGMGAVTAGGGRMRGAMEGQELPSWGEVAKLRPTTPQPAEQAVAATTKETPAEAAAEGTAPPAAGTTPPAEGTTPAVAAANAAEMKKKQDWEAASKARAERKQFAQAAATAPQPTAAEQAIGGVGASLPPAMAKAQPGPGAQPMTAGGVQHPYAATSASRLKAFQQSPMMTNLRAESAARMAAKANTGGGTKPTSVGMVTPKGPKKEPSV